MTLQYRDELLHLRSVELSRTGAGRDTGPGPLQRRSSGIRRDWNRAMVSEEEKDQVAMDLLAILQKIPIQVIGESDRSFLSDRGRGRSVGTRGSPREGGCP